MSKHARKLDHPVLPSQKYWSKILSNDIKHNASTSCLRKVVRISEEAPAGDIEKIVGN